MRENNQKLQVAVVSLIKGSFVAADDESQKKTKRNGKLKNRDYPNYNISEILLNTDENTENFVENYYHLSPMKTTSYYYRNNLIPVKISVRTKIHIQTTDSLPTTGTNL